jgi:hypothetical protein
VHCCGTQVEASLKVQRSEEAAHGLEAELVAARQALTHQQGSQRAKDKEVERLGRALEQLRASEFEVTAKLLQARAAWLLSSRVHTQLGLPRLCGVAGPWHATETCMVPSGLCS